MMSFVRKGMIIDSIHVYLRTVGNGGGALFSVQAAE